MVQISTEKYRTAPCSTVQYSTVQYSTQYSTVQYTTVQYSTQYSTIHYSTEHNSLSAVQRSTSGEQIEPLGCVYLPLAGHDPGGQQEGEEQLVLLQQAATHVLVHTDTDTYRVIVRRCNS